MKTNLMILVAALAVTFVVTGCDSAAYRNSVDLTTGETISDGKVVREGVQPEEVRVSLDSQPQADQVTPVGGLVKRWGRVMIGAAQASGEERNFNIENGYACFYFHPNGTLEYDGVHFTRPFRATGTYQFDWPAKKITWTLTRITEPEDDSHHRELLGTYEAELKTDENGRNTIEYGLFRFVEDVYWDTEARAYRDGDGDLLVLDGSQPARFVTERAPEEGTSEECMNCIRGVWKAMAGHRQLGGGDIKSLAELNDPGLVKCPISGRPFQYTPGPETIRCTYCHQQIN